MWKAIERGGWETIRYKHLEEYFTKNILCKVSVEKSLIEAGEKLHDHPDVDTVYLNDGELNDKVIIGIINHQIIPPAIIPIGTSVVGHEIGIDFSTGKERLVLLDFEEDPLIKDWIWEGNYPEME